MKLLQRIWNQILGPVVTCTVILGLLSLGVLLALSVKAWVGTLLQYFSSAS